jgi:hypothetical protein
MKIQFYLLTSIVLVSLLSLRCAKKTDQQSENIPKKSITVKSEPEKTDRWTSIPVGAAWNSSFGLNDGTVPVSYFVYNATPFVAYPELNEKGLMGQATVKRFVDGVWQFVGKPRFTKGDADDISLFVYGGIPYMTYYDSETGRNFLKFDGAQWNIIAGSPCGENSPCGQVSMFVSNDTPYVAILTPDSLHPIKFSRFNGTSWQTIAEVSSTKPISHLSLDISSGVPYIAYTVGKGEMGDSGTADVIKYDGKNFIPVGDTGIFIGPRYSLSICTLHGVPYLSMYSSLLTGSLSEKASEVKRFNGKTWESVTIPAAYITGELVPVSINNTLYPAGMKGDRGSTSCYFLCTETDSAKLTPSAIQPPTFWNSWKTWRYVGEPGFVNDRIDQIRLEVDHGIPYVAFFDMDSQRIAVMNYGQNGWEYVGKIKKSGENSSFDLRVYNDTPYVALTDSGNGYKVSVFKYNGNKWKPVGKVGFSEGKAGSPSLFISNSTPFLAYNDYADSGKICVMKYSGTDWVPVGKRGFSNTGINISLFVYQDTPFIAYGDAIHHNKVTVMKFNGVEWEPVGDSLISTGIGNNFSFFINEGTPYVAYIDNQNSSRLAVRKYTENSWKPVGDSAISEDDAFRPSLYFDNGTPYISYTRVVIKDSVIVKKYNGNSWEIVGWSGIMSGASTLYVNEGIPFVACEEDSGLTVMEYR